MRCATTNGMRWSPHQHQHQRRLQRPKKEQYGVVLPFVLTMCQINGAGEESRTLDLNLGKVALYQLSYSRIYNLIVYTGISVFLC